MSNQGEFHLSDAAEPGQFANIKEGLEQKLRVSYQEANPHLRAAQVVEIVGGAFAGVRAEHQDFDRFLREMLTIGLLPDWSRVTPLDFLRMVYTACKFNPEVQARIDKSIFESGLPGDPLGWLKMWIGVRYLGAHPEVAYDDILQLVAAAFRSIELLHPNFKELRYVLWACFHGFAPNFEFITVPQYLEALWTLATYAQFAPKHALGSTESPTGSDVLQ